ncbi:AbiJ-NTD4 domain-containing protein [Pseudomonas soli]|uniref:AbiJ-NTD4 domain-containing protein n=1 Tax=Pseudomonas soli TaxID=1306993 RepID=UPI00345DEE7E
MDFSQRMGLAPVHVVAQTESIDGELLVSLWNVICLQLFSQYRPGNHIGIDILAHSNFNELALKVYSGFFKKPVDFAPESWKSFKQELRDFFFKSPWHRIYSFLEFLVSINYGNSSGQLVREFNKVLERENSAYRFLSGCVTPITSTEEVKEVESAIGKSDRYAGVRTHLQTALGLLTDRENPDYRNSIKESISAVESLAKKLVDDDKATLGQALKTLETKHGLHTSLKSAFMTLYGYTSDASGIRHGLLDGDKPCTKADARFMLICCSAFINFAIDSIEE